MLKGVGEGMRKINLETRLQTNVRAVAHAASALPYWMYPVEVTTLDMCGLI